MKFLTNIRICGPRWKDVKRVRGVWMGSGWGLGSAWPHTPTHTASPYHSLTRSITHPLSRPLSHSLTPPLIRPLSCVSDPHATSLDRLLKSEVQWKFAADDRVQEMAANVREGEVTLGMTLTLNASRALDPELFLQAITLAYRKMDVLRLCFRHRRGDLWLAEMTHPTIDFTVSNGTDLDEEMTTLLKQPYNEHDGPMWKTQLIICPQDAPCNVPHIKKHFPYQYHLQFTTNHAVHDGLTQLVVVQCIFNILDDLLQGVRVNDESFGQVRDRTEARQVEDTIRAELEKDPRQIESLLTDHIQRETTPLITQAFGVPEEPNPETHCMKPHVIDPCVMQRFNKHCRSLGVTLNSGFLGVFNTALVEVVREAGLEMDQYTISNAHPVNCSRLVREPGLHLGFHALPMTLTMVTPCDVRANFWGYVKQVDTEFRKKLRENCMIKERVLDKMLRQYGYSSDTDPHPLKYNYLVVNIYSPKVKNFGTGRHLQLTDLINHVGFTNQNFAILQGLGGMKDQVRYQLMYSSRRITKRNAEKLSNKTIDVLYDITRMLN